MSTHPNAHTIAGGWLGTYYYSTGSLKPVRFEATFTLTGEEGHFGGTILDDNTLGEARVIEGIQSGNEVVFTKVYIAPPEGGGIVPVHYEGTMSEDGKLLNGTWLLRSKERRSKEVTLRGTWNARRLWTELVETVEDFAPEALRRELVTIGTR